MVDVVIIDVSIMVIPVIMDDILNVATSIAFCMTIPGRKRSCIFSKVVMGLESRRMK